MSLDFRPSKPEPVDSLRGRLRTAADQIPGIETLIRIVQDGCEAKRKVRVSGFKCAKCGAGCGHWHTFEIEDAKVARETLAFVLEQTEGRPGTANAEEAGVVVKRIVVGVDE